MYLAALGSRERETGSGRTFASQFFFVQIYVRSTSILAFQGTIRCIVSFPPSGGLVAKVRLFYVPFDDFSCFSRGST